MPWIRTTPAEDAEGQLKDLFTRLKIEKGRMFTPYEVMTTNGSGLAALVQLGEVLRFGPSDVTRVQREMIAAYVSALNDCTF